MNVRVNGLDWAVPPELETVTIDIPAALAIDDTFKEAPTLAPTIV